MHAFGFVTLLCACHADAPPQDLTFRQVMQYPKALRDKFVSYWLDHLPDTSEHEVIDIKKMQYWTRSEKKPLSKEDKRLMAKMPHKLLAGLQGKLTNWAIDCCIGWNEWCVVFLDKHDRTVNMIKQFAVSFWTAYCSKMKGFPDPGSKAPQRILLYLITNEDKLSRSWRNRLYYYSSGSILGSLTTVDFNKWLTETGPEVGFKCLRKLEDANGLFALIGAAIFEIISRKPNPFPMACLSKEQYTKVCPYKRAMIYLFLCRFLHKKTAQKQWMKYTEAEYNFNVRVFRRYMRVDDQILQVTKAFLDLPVKTPPERLKKRQKRKRRRDQMTSPSASEPSQVRYTVQDDSDTDKETHALQFTNAAKKKVPQPSSPAVQHDSSDTDDDNSSFHSSEEQV